MLSHLALPPEGHLEMVYHIFAYLKNKPHAKIVFDDAASINESAFQNNCDWSKFYGDVTKELPPKMPKPLGKPVHIGCFVDANHAGNLVTCRSHSDILVFVMNLPILWLSRRQNTN